MRLHPTPIEAQPSRREGRERSLSRPRNSFGPSYRPPHDERRRLRASVVVRLGGGAAHPVNAYVAGRERASHQTRSLPDLWLMIVGSWRSVAHASSRSLTSSVPTGSSEPSGSPALFPVTPRGTSPSRRPSLARAWKAPLARSCERESTAPFLCRVCVRSVSGSSSRSRYAGETARRLRRTPI
jgi:hypothetical protein